MSSNSDRAVPMEWTKMAESENEPMLFPVAREDELFDAYGDDEDYDRERESGHRDRVVKLVAAYLGNRKRR